MSVVTDELLLRIAVIGGAVAAEEVAAFSDEIARAGMVAEDTAAKIGTGTKAGSLSGALTSLKALFAGLFIADAIKQFSSFQSQMERLRTQTGATQAEVSRMSKGILGMAVSVGTGPNSLAQALYHIESAGFRGKAALDALRISAEGAKVGGSDLTDTTTGLTAVLVAGFKGVTTLREAMGQLNATVGAGDMTFQDLNDALSTGILATIKPLGLQVKDLGAALAVLGDNNIRGAQAATRLRMGLMMLVKPSSTAAEAMARVHLGTYQLAEDLRKPDGLLFMLEDLRKHLEGFSKTQQNATLAAIFGGGRNSAAMLTLIGQLGRLKTKYDDVNKAGHSFGQDFADTTKTLSFFIDQVKALAEVILIRLGGALNAAVGWIEGKLIPAFEHGKIWAEAIVGAVLGIGIAIMAALIPAVIALTASLIGLAVETAPFVAIGIAIVLLITHFKQVKAVALDVFHWIENAATAVWDWLKTHWPLLLTILTGPFGLTIAFIHAHWPGLLSALLWPFKELWKILRSIWDGILSDVRWVVRQIEKLISTVLGPIKTVTHFLGNVAGGALHGIGSVASTVGNFLGFGASGLYANSAGYAVVGERGPEMVYLPAGAQVIPNERLGGLGDTPLEATIVMYNVLDGKVMSRSVVRQGLMATARRGAGGPTIADAG